MGRELGRVSPTSRHKPHGLGRRPNAITGPDWRDFPRRSATTICDGRSDEHRRYKGPVDGTAVPSLSTPPLRRPPGGSAVFVSDKMSPAPAAASCEWIISEPPGWGTPV